MVYTNSFRMEVGRYPPEGVENEECCYCFKDFDSEEGVNICLQCFTCCCNEHANKHVTERGHTTFLARKRITTVSEKEATKLAIGVDGGFDDVSYSNEYELRMFDGEGYEVIPDGVIEEEEPLALIEKIKAAPSASTADQVQSWELAVVECPHVINLKQENVTPNPTMKCKDCDLDKNLWLCLECGYVGCGRKNWDGSGGNNHAIDHSKATGHCVVVKMGTISPDGRADLFCYNCDETVSDSHIGEHLAKLGIDVQTTKKTEATTTELSVEINKNWDFDATTVDGKEFEAMTGPFSVGLKNLGNTCYTNTILQILAVMPEFVQECLTPEAGNARWTDPRRQFFKLMKAMREGELQFVSPRMLRSTIVKDNEMFRGTQQQDAVEFYQYLARFIKVHNPATCLNKTEFDMTQVITCTKCADMSTIPLKDQNFIMLTPPWTPDCDTERKISIEELFEMTLCQSLPKTCDNCQNGEAITSSQFRNFPDYLFVAVQLDIVTTTGTIRKMNLDVQLDPTNLDLTKYKCTTEESVDERKVAELMNFGFSRAQCVRALQNVQTVEAAVEWIMDNPMEKSPAVMQVMEMGFTEDEARDALEETSGNVALAIEWLFGPREKKSAASKTNGSGVYELIAFAQHKGTSALAGHYVATVLRDGKWVLYNDRKVHIYPDSEPPAFGKGYLYLYKRK